MIKTSKVQKMIDENGIEIENYTMVIKLKKIIEDLNRKIANQNETIIALKRDCKTTKINEMEVEMQHLNDENKRLVLLIEEYRSNSSKTKESYSNSKKHKKSKASMGTNNQNFMKASAMLTKSTSGFLNSTKSNQQPKKTENKEDLNREKDRGKKYQHKYFQVLAQVEKLKKELINIKVFESGSPSKRQKSLNPNDGNSFILEQNMQTLEKANQKRHDLEAENNMLKKKNLEMESKIRNMEKENSEFKVLLSELKTEIKCRNIASEKALHSGETPYIQSEQIDCVKVQN